MDSGNELPETKETYWRWGVPSLILAGVTLSSMALSYFFVDPNILSRYEAMVVDSQDLGQLLSFHMDLVVHAKAQQCGAKHGLLRDLWSFTCNTLEVI